MALLQRVKTRFVQNGVDKSVLSEIYTELSADDVVAFMAFSEAERLYVLAPRGENRESQTPGDELKSYLMDVRS
jgi:hypothetical protein